MAYLVDRVVDITSSVIQCIVYKCNTEKVICSILKYRGILISGDRSFCYQLSTDCCVDVPGVCTEHKACSFYVAGQVDTICGKWNGTVNVHCLFIAADDLMCMI